MINTTLIDELSFKIKSLVKSSRGSDIEKNLNALIRGTLTKLELVTREEYEVQVAVLAKTQAKLSALEAQVAELEAQLADKPEQS